MPRINYKFFKFCIILFFFGLFFRQDVFAAYQIQIPLPDAAAGTSFSDPAAYIRHFFIFGLSLLAFLTVAVITTGGIMYITAGSLTSVDRAKEMIKSAVFGLFLLLGSYLLVFTLDPAVTNLSAVYLNRYNLAPHEGKDFSDEAIQKSSLAKGAYAEYINKYTQKYNLDPNLVKAIIQAESGGDPNAQSQAGACGLMQLMPVHKVSNCNDPEENIAAGTKFLSYLSERYKGDQNKILAAYNWGPGNLEKKCGGDPSGCSKLPKETETYIKKVTRYKSNFSS